jgi:hypothetical protein
MTIKIVNGPISLEEVSALAKEIYHDMVKGVVDIERDVIALGGEWHVDANNELLRKGSKQKNLWGFNLYPQEKSENVVEYISLINIRPADNNRDMEIKSENVRNKMLNIIKRFIPELFV